jgi:membrane protein DedA with SNARE-associated domain
MLAQLMNILITLISNLYIETGLIGICLIMILESCHVPLPASEIVIPIAGVLITRGYILPGMPLWESIALVSLASSFGCLIGSVIVYAIGRAGGRQMLIKYGRYVLISQRDVERADRFFLRWGSATIFYSRLLPVVRTWASLPAGVTKSPFIKFSIYTWCGSLIWCTALTYLGTVLSGNIDKFKPIFSSLSVCIVAVCVILVALYVWNRVRDSYHEQHAR